MFGEFCLYGVFIPTLFALMLAAYLLQNLISLLLLRLGVYRFVWHPPLFNLSLFILLLGGVSVLARGLLT